MLTRTLFPVLLAMAGCVFGCASSVVLEPGDELETSGDDERADSPAAVSADAELARVMPEYYSTETIFAASGIAVVRAPTGAVLLRMANCAEMPKELAALAALRQRSEPSFRLGTVTQRRMPSGWCEAKVDKVLSPYLAQTLGKVIDDNGIQSNCWGHSALVAGTVNGVKELSADGFTYLMRSPLCHRLTATEQPRAGDLIVFRGAEVKNGRASYSEVHTAVWISDRLWSSKNGAGSFVIASPDAIKDLYFSADSPRDCRDRSPESPSLEYVQRCESLFDIYSCESTATYAARQSTPSAIYTAELSRVRPWLWETIHQQWEYEKEADSVVFRGDAYISRSLVNPVGSWFSARGNPVPAAIKTRLTTLSRDRFLKAEYPLSAPAVPTVSLPRCPAGDECERYDLRVRGYQAAVTPLFRAMTRATSAHEKVLLELLAHEAISSQLAPEVPDSVQSMIRPDRAMESR